MAMGHGDFARYMPRVAHLRRLRLSSRVCTSTMLLVIRSLSLDQAPKLHASSIGGIGALGDTLTDEYEFALDGTRARN